METQTKKSKVPCLQIEGGLNPTHYNDRKMIVDISLSHAESICASLYSQQPKNLV